jgi:HK97 family phage portal protein
MRLFGWEIKRTSKSLSPPDTGRWFAINDPYPGAWQQDQPIELRTVLTFSAVFACIRLITSDIGKMRLRVMERQGDILVERETSAFAPVLRRPNPFQNRIKFVEQWISSKLLFGNAYILKTRDARGMVSRLQVLNPERVQTLVSETGEVFYTLKKDRMQGLLDADVTVPATEIIHDVHVIADHPLVGLSPLSACALSATQGTNIQTNSEAFFGNQARPSGILTAPGAISKDTAERIKEQWHTNYGGANSGKVAVMGDGLKFEGVSMSAVDAQLIEQLEWTAEDVCRAFGVPGYKIGVGDFPPYNNLAALNQSYYDDTLQELIECLELGLKEGLDMPERLEVRSDVDTLLRMDKGSRYASYEIAIRAGWKSPNEVRRSENLPDVTGGDTPYLQQQNYSLGALAQRDAMNPLADPGPNPQAGNPPPPGPQMLSLKEAQLIFRGAMNGR